MTPFECIERLSHVPPGRVREAIEQTFSGMQRVDSALRWATWYAEKEGVLTDHVACPRCGRVALDKGSWVYCGYCAGQAEKV